MNALLAAVLGAVPFDIKADQEIRANTDQFPEAERHRQVAADADAQHREREQRQKMEEAVEPATAVQMLAVGQVNFVVDEVMQLVVHVAESVNVYAGRDKRHHGRT